MKVQILDHRVMQLIFRPSKALLDFVASDITDEKEKLPIACKIVSTEEKDDQEFFVYFKIETSKQINAEGVTDDGLFHVDFLVRCKSSSSLEDGFSEILKKNAIEAAFPVLAGWVNNFFLSSGYDSFYVSQQNLI